MPLIIDGQAIAQVIKQEIQAEIRHLEFQNTPCLAVILVGDNPASQVYVRMKQKACAEVGIISRLLQFPSSILQQELLNEVKRLNQDSQVHGILVQLPLPSHIQPDIIMENMNPEKDVDGLHPINMGKLLIGNQDTLTPCTPKGILVLLDRYQIEPKGKHVVILGRSNIVGKPLAALLMQKSQLGNATVTIAHSASENLNEICQSADILVAAIGQANFITPRMIRKGAVVIDVGTNRILNSVTQKTQIVGDVDFNAVAPLCSAITRVPGGVGPMTIAMLLNNTLISCKRQHGMIK